MTLCAHVVYHSIVGDDNVIWRTGNLVKTKDKGGSSHHG